MKETGTVLYESGHVVDVSIVSLGDELAADASAAATILTLGDCADFDPDAHALIAGAVYTVTAVDDDANTITIDPGLADDCDEGDAVDLWDPLYAMVSSYKSVQVRVLSGDSNEDVIDAVLTSHLVDKLDEGIRGTTGESVLLELDGDEWRIVDVLGFGDPNAGLGGAVKFYDLDTFTVDSLGDQEFTLTYTPIEGSLHMAWNTTWQPHTEMSRAGRAVTIADSDDLIKVGDTIDFRYAYRAGETRVEPEIDDPWIIRPPGEPTLSAGLGTSGPDLAGSGDVWIDGNPATGVTLRAVDNALGRDHATLQMPSRTDLPTDATGLQLRCFVNVTSGTFQEFCIRLTEGIDGSGILFGDILSDVGDQDYVMSGDLQAFLDHMSEEEPVWIYLFLDSVSAPIGEEAGFFAEMYFRIEEG